jgi:hypothetical protein
MYTNAKFLTYTEYRERFKQTVRAKVLSKSTFFVKCKCHFCNCLLACFVSSIHQCSISVIRPHYRINVQSFERPVRLAYLNKAAISEHYFSLRTNQHQLAIWEGNCVTQSLGKVN